MRTRLARRLLVVLAVAGVGTAIATAMSPAGIVKAAQNGTFGSLLVSSSGMTLYHLTSEKPGSIRCTGSCAAFWPPLLLASGTKLTAGAGVTAAKLGTIKRPNGQVQVTYNKMALYRYSLDKKAGDVKGQGVQGTWFAVTAAGKLAKAAAPAPVATTTPVGYGYGG